MVDFLGRSGSLPFLDQIEKEAAELRNARAEHRDPDFSLENLAPLHAQLIKEEQDLKERFEKSKLGKFIHTMEVDLNDASSVGDLIDKLLTHKKDLEKEGDTTPSSLLPGVDNPTINDTVTPETVNVPEPTVPTQNTVSTPADQDPVDNAELPKGETNTVDQNADNSDSPLGPGEPAAEFTLPVAKDEAANFPSDQEFGSSESTD